MGLLLFCGMVASALGFAMASVVVQPSVSSESSAATSKRQTYQKQVASTSTLEDIALTGNLPRPEVFTENEPKLLQQTCRIPQPGMMTPPHWTLGMV